MSTNTKKKRGAVAAVVIIVLCLAALGALGYVIWQQFHPAVPETAAGYVASAESTAPVYDEKGELLGSLPAAARCSMFWRMPRATPSASGWSTARATPASTAPT